MITQVENQDKTSVVANSNRQTADADTQIIRKTVLMSDVFFTAVEDYRWSARMNFSEAVVALAELGLAVQRGEFIPKR